ncbi:methionine ABC transporter ATP-binding protein [Marinicrinis lubricantis]|uniref:Methionine ABC transporter ATP-binding protein n=1 Tax=Marinicrinis lubricantis TaxID=2086470 RepID=A0ABW1IL97_9BACL
MIKLEGLTKIYQSGKQTLKALDELDLDIVQGEIFGIIGHSGAGKSTLIRCINLLEKPSEGRVYVNGVELTALKGRKLQAERRNIGMIFQHFNLLSSATVFENIAFPLRLVKTNRNEVKRRVEELAQLVGLEAHLSKYPSQLSGGQKQRVGIARALANHPHVLLCDEATSALDPETTKSILQLLLDINRKLNLTIVLITHEMQVIRDICDRVAVIDQGKIVESGKVVDVFLRPQHPVTRQFVSQVNDHEEVRSYAEGSLLHSLLKISFKGETTYQPVLFETIRDTGLSFSILQGSISKMKDLPYGQLIIELHGEAADAGRTAELLKQKGLEVEVL